MLGRVISLMRVAYRQNGLVIVPSVALFCDPASEKALGREVIGVSGNPYQPQCNTDNVPDAWPLTILLVQV